ncbi:MAG TPA: heparinase II/III family protein, partial [Lacipirellulaceae bacterium]|nr:heparinase II/III family protein [Lacipirellulaceae bacterium]
MRPIHPMKTLILFFAPLIATLLAISSRAEETTYPPKVPRVELERRIKEIPHTHPRLLVTSDQLTNLAKSLNTDPLRRALADAIIRDADALQSAPPIERKLIGRRLLDKSRACLERVLLLSTAYHLTHDTKYVDRCRQEMLAAAHFTDWHPDHFLDTAEMTCALAIGYDWLFDQLDEPARKEIREAIVQKGLRVPYDTQFNKWQRMTNNWGQVCHGGLTLGALAVAEDEPELAAHTIDDTLQNVVLSMAAYAPNGGYPEGPGYWSYGTSYNVLLISALESALGTDFGLSKAPGFDHTGEFPALACGPSGLFFNYADGGEHRGPESIRFWFVDRYHHPDWLRNERDLWQQAADNSKAGRPAGLHFATLALLWMQPPQENVKPEMPLAWQSKGVVPIALLRSSWDDATATFVGLKAGAPAGHHGHMDAGSFVLDADGIRWASDLGMEDYNGIEQRHMDLWGTAQDSDRWTIFRLSNFGHNTLVIDDQLQHAAGNTTITKFSDNPKLPFAIVELTPVYKDQVKSARRGIMILPSHEV